MSQEPLPPQYASSEQVLNGISVAFSTLINPRRLESMWNSPYIQTFNELVASYKGQFITYSPYTLWIPGLILKERKLKKKFEEIGLDYDTQYSAEIALDVAVETLREQRSQIPVQPVQPQVAGSSPPRKSSRLVQEAAAKRTVTNADRTRLKANVERLLDERADIIEMRQELVNKNKKIADLGNTSFDSMTSSHDRESISNEPDLFVAHVSTVKLPEPKSEDEKALYELRAGRKTCHQCGAVIVELKKGAERTLEKEDYWTDGGILLDEAIGDLLCYCSAYFASYPGMETVVAFAAAGPLWKWANIKRSDTPGWDFLLEEPSDKDERLILRWPNRFGDTMFTLGTPASDKELTYINHQHIYPLLNHTPVTPAHLEHQDEGDDDEEGEEKENE